MPTTFGSLYSLIYDWDNLELAFNLASKKKHLNPAVLKYKYHLEENLTDLQNRLIWHMWEPQPFAHFVIFEPKRREIAAPPFCDRVLHHALCNVINPLFERRFLNCSFACRKGYGNHKAVNALQQYIREAVTLYDNPYNVYCDIEGFFGNIPHDWLKESYRRVIRCADTLSLMDLIVDKGIPGPKGVPIGALPSQLFANVTLDPLDHFVKEELHLKRYVRQNDDFVVVCPDKVTAREVFWELQTYVEFRIGLKMNKKSCVMPVSRGIDYCGYRIWPSCRLPRKRNVNRMRRRVKRMACLYRASHNKDLICGIQERWNSFALGYMKHCKKDITITAIWLETGAICNSV